MVRGGWGGGGTIFVDFSCNNFRYFKYLKKKSRMEGGQHSVNQTWVKMFGLREI